MPQASVASGTSTDGAGAGLPSIDTSAVAMSEVSDHDDIVDVVVVVVVVVDVVDVVVVVVVVVVVGFRSPR